MPAIKRILGFALGDKLFTVAPPEEDAERNTDLVVLDSLSGKRITVRVRGERYLAKWPDQFTVRSRRESGAETELAKLLGGWGDYGLYAFAGARILKWTVMDWEVFRTLWRVGPPALNEIPNGDGTWLAAFDFTDLPATFVLKSGGPASRDPLPSPLPPGSGRHRCIKSDFSV